ncbi:twin-arginine translocation signal domain-containing protein [Deltaproteobacteria bacterium PRO3]|nr:twin-arginine translocation signal domain-containing protein [Deltaproteobacteria bacterium PRO3]
MRGKIRRWSCPSVSAIPPAIPRSVQRRRREGRISRSRRDFLRRCGAGAFVSVKNPWPGAKRAR